MRTKNMKYHFVKDVVFVLFTAMLVLCLAFFVSETVESQRNDCVTVDEEAYQVLEEKYVGEIKDYLDKQGYRNSGVTLTRVVEADGERTYEVTLHHKNLYKLSLEEQEELLFIIEEMSFQVAGCEFQAELL